MIKVDRIEKPAELTEAVQKELTEEFKQDKKKAVWNKKYIRESLIRECNNKCVYCECFIGEGYKEMHVDHFHCKEKYKDEVVAWHNLNPSCPQCNKNKSSHDTYEDPIINPFEQDPREYFYLKNYRYYCKNENVAKIASTTIDILGLNDTENVVKQRFLQGEALLEKIKDIYELAYENRSILHTEVRKRNRVLCGCRNILTKGTKTAEYSAFMATIIETDDYYIKLRELLISLGLWDESLQKLDSDVDSLKMSLTRDST